MTTGIADESAYVAGGPGARRAPGGEREGRSHLADVREREGRSHLAKRADYSHIRPKYYRRGVADATRVRYHAVPRKLFQAGTTR